MAKKLLYIMSIFLVVFAAGGVSAEELGDYYVIEDFERYTTHPGDPNYFKDFWKGGGGYYDLDFNYPHGGTQAVRIEYWTKDPPWDCGVGRTETPWIPADWTFDGEAETLSLWFRVNDEIIAPTDNADELYVTLTDSSDRTATVQYSDRWDPNTIQITGYHEWNIGLSEFTDVTPLFDLENVKDIEMGIGDGLGSPPTIPGEGDLFFDDIRLYPYVLPAIYVAIDGNDVTGDGSEENPFRTIQKGIDTATDVNTVIVLPGTYVENINFNGKNLTLMSTDPSDSNIVANTIIDGSQNGSVVTFSGTESPVCVLSGFTITNGYADGPPDGGGIYGNHTSATIQYNNIVGNTAFWGGFPGAAIGGGLYRCDGIIQYNIISNNVTYAPDMESFSAGGGLGKCHGIIKNNTIVNNSAGGGGGLYDCDGLITNCIVWANTDAQLSGCTTPTYSCIQNWTEGGIGNIDTDPCFVEPGYWDPNGTPEDANDDFWVEGDYHLKSEAGRWDANSQSWVQDDVTSPCIDAGNPGCPLGSESNDVNNVRRNMGAYGGTAQASKSPANWALLADLTNDHTVDINDLEVFVGYWLDSGECIPSDLNRNKHVDFNDFSIFADEWSGTISYPGSSIVYEISDCDMGSLTVEQPGQTRFSVTVEGQYIQFEDMMLANCCPNELEMEMTLEDDLIIIQEIGGDGICDCLCDFAVTATLGPFEPDTYTLEVYQEEYYGGFIGSTTVTIIENN